MQHLKVTLAIILLTGLLAGCSSREPQKEPAARVLRPFRDTMAVSGSAAVFFEPGSEQLLQIRDKIDTGSYESMLHDCFYQMKHCRNVLDKSYPSVNQLRADSVRWIRFVYPDKKDTLIDLERAADPCGVFLFDGRQRPRPIDMTNAETESAIYFKG